MTPQSPKDRLSERRAAIRSRATRRPLKEGVLLASQGPSLRVETRGADAIVIGKASDFSVALINEGNTVAGGVHVRVALPRFVQVIMATSQAGPLRPQNSEAHQQTLDWVVDQVAPGAEQVLKLTLKPTENQPFDLAVDWTLRLASAAAQITVQKPELELALFGPKDMLYGKTGVFTIQITNPGSGPAEDVSLSFVYGKRQLPAKAIGTIAAGEQTEVDVELTAAEAGMLRVAAVATASEGLRAEAAEQVQVRRGRLEVDIIGSAMEFAGSTTKYQIRVKNAGDATAADLIANVTLPEGARRVAVRDASGTPDSDLAFRIGSLSPGAERVFTLVCQLTNPGANRIEAAVSGSEELSAIQAFVTQVRALADLKLLVNDPPGPTAVGDEAVFEMRIMNRGTKAAEQISVVAQFSEGIEPVEANGGTATIVPGQVLFQPIPRIDAGGEITLKIIARATKEGSHRFRAQVSASDPDTRLVAEESTYFFDAVHGSRTARKPE
ncbi:MAG: CARDB domain-containing protein [Pirellulaceae bacterium]